MGKFIASSLNALYGLLAVLPVIALPLLLGGVYGAEFWRMALALANALFFSLAAGICISSFVKDSQFAMGNTLCGILCVAGGLPALAYLGQQLRLSSAWLSFTWASPFFPFSHAAQFIYSTHSGKFWGTLVASNSFAWLLLALASWRLPLAWREGGATLASAGWERFWLRASRRNPPRRTKLRADLLSKNPVLWLLSKNLGLHSVAWVIVLAWGVMVAATMLAASSNTVGLVHYSAQPFGFLFKIVFALCACRFFAEGRRNGALELLACTPLANREIVRGQILALSRNFFWPVVIFLAFLFAPICLHFATAIWNRSFDPVLSALAVSFLSAVYAGRMLMDLLALCWFGIGPALTTRKPQLAPARTILYVLVLPSILAFCWLDVLADIFFIAWGVAKSQWDLRRLLAEQYEQA